jgi:hypothetical protein
MACIDADTLGLAAAESTAFLDHVAVLDPVAGKACHLVEHVQWIEPTNLELDFTIDENCGPSMQCSVTGANFRASCLAL